MISNGYIYDRLSQQMNMLDWAEINTVVSLLLHKNPLL